MPDETIAVNMKFGGRLLARADACARERGVSRSEFIRFAVDAECARSEAQAARRERLAKAAGTAGVHPFPGGLLYEGELHNGLPHGRGVMKRPDGSRIEASFRNGEPHGKGILVWPNGTRIESEWRDGKPVDGEQ